MNKIIFKGVIVALGIVIGTGVYAQESDADSVVQEVMQEGAIQLVIGPVSIEDQNSEALQAIAIQLQDIEAEVNGLTLLVSRVVEPSPVEEQNSEALQPIAIQVINLEAEVNRLSLVVSKVVLEHQALALQGQLNQMTGISSVGQEQVAGSNVEGFGGVVGVNDNAGVPAMEDPPAVAVIDSTAEDNLFEGNNADDLNELPMPIVATEDDSNDSGGFLAGVKNAMGNIGTPEIVTVLILAVLAIFVILRRVTSRGKNATVSIPVNDVIESDSQLDEIDEKRQEIQEKVAWK